MISWDKKGQLFICRDYYLLFFTKKHIAEEFSIRFMGDDFFMTSDEANYEIVDYRLIGGSPIVADIYRPREPILLIDIENVEQKVWNQEKVVCNVILGERVGWIPLHLGSFEKYFIQITR